MDDAFSSIDQVVQCLIDEPRTNAFRKAIEETVKKGDHVFDLGTGSGVMALFAARVGAEKVTAVEFDPFVAETARRIVAANGFKDVVTIVSGDARLHQFERGVTADVVIAEMLTTGLVDEYQVAAINNLHKQGIITPKTRFVPTVQETYAALIKKDFSLYGFDFKLVQHLWNNLSESHKRYPLSNTVLLNSLDFTKPIADTFEGRVVLKASTDGVANALYLTSKTILSPGVDIADTETLDAPVVIPLESPLKLSRGKKVTLDIAYSYGRGYQSFVVSVV